METTVSETRERVHIEDGAKRVRTYFGGELVADTKHLKLVWEVPYYPAYYFPRQDVHMDFLSPNGRTQHSPSRGDAHNFTIKAGGREGVNGVKIADTRKPTLLFETRLPTRFYIPKLDIRMDLLTPTDTVTGCAYKGFAQYWSVKAGSETIKDLAWSYKTPFPENAKIAGLVAFYNEKADFIVDGERQTRPKTKFS